MAEIRQQRAQAARNREAIDIKRYFTSFEVHTCPRCTTSVLEVDVQREEEEHSCRLCGKEAQVSSPMQVAEMRAQANALDLKVKLNEQRRTGLVRDIQRLQSDVDNATREIELLSNSAKQKKESEHATPEEEAQKGEIYRRIGELQYKQGQFKRQANESSAAGEESKAKANVQERVRDTLKSMAEEQNRQILSSLSLLTEEMTRSFGTTSVTDVTCSPVGKLSLKKNGEQVAFTSIKNSGERLRIKLAFYIALMRLGRLHEGASAGRHPGLLLIDQPASSEMIPEHVAEVAAALRQLDETQSEDIQIICFTADATFEQATVSSKVYGPQAPPYAF